MATERVELTITTGSEPEFERQFAVAGKLLRSAAGCQGVQLARGIESPSKYLLLIEWRAVEDHVAFTKTEGMVQFRNLVGPYFAGKPAMEHFDRTVTL